MADRPLDFDIYRLNKVDEDGLLPYMGQAVADDRDILRIIERAASDPECDVTTEREKAVTIYSWGLREFVEIDNAGISGGLICSVVLARSIAQQTGVIVTDVGLEIGTSTPDRRPGLTVNLIFFMDRHVCAVEYKGSLMGSQSWRSALHEILDKAVQRLEYTSTLRIEPVAKNAEVLETFRSFSLLTRLRLKLLIPNPDMTREMKDLTEEMKEGGVREWLQDMRNRKGLSQAKGKLPLGDRASAGGRPDVGAAHPEGGGLTEPRVCVRPPTTSRVWTTERLPCSRLSNCCEMPESRSN